MMRTSLALSAAALLACSGATDGKELVDTGNLRVIVSDQAVEGAFSASSGEISFAVDALGGGAYQARVWVGEQELGIDLDDAGEHQIQPGGELVVVDEALKAPLGELMAQFTSHLQEHRDIDLVDRLYRVVNFLSSHPVGGEIAPRAIIVDKAGRSIASLCGQLGQYHTATHDAGGVCWWCDTHGDMNQTFWVGGGSDPFGDGCLGVCGGGCAGTDYSQDCLDHDACEGHHGNSGAASIPGGVCSDEYASASDDWLSAPNCGTHGAGPGGMCSGACGGYSASYGCYCDSLCSSYGDCCSDGSASSVCGY